MALGGANEEQAAADDPHCDRNHQQDPLDNNCLFRFWEEAVVHRGSEEHDRS